MADAEELAKRLDDPAASRRVREAAIAELVEICRRDEAARRRWLMRFVTLLSDDAPIIRGWASLGVVLCDEEGSHVDRVARLLSDPSPGVRLQAVHALAPLDLPELHDRFASLLADGDELVRLAAAAALASGGDLRGTDALVAASARRNTRLDALLALRPAAQSGSPEVRAAVQEAARRAFGRLFANRFERVAAAALLAATGDAGGAAHLLERARKGGVERPMALEICGELRIPGGEEVARAAASDPRDPLRGTALRALASYGSADAVERCRAALVDAGEDPDVRCDAAEGLLIAGGDRAREILERAREEVSDDHLRRVVTTCISLFGRPAEEIRLYLPLSGDEVIGSRTPGGGAEEKE
ncbi:MAG TPA: HEAT repeat domain-containing protein [Vulgatibacter sp.]|nr:HEAT repeat domain-containing protein [Vulgatibacter sp.]